MCKMKNFSKTVMMYASAFFVLLTPMCASAYADTASLSAALMQREESLSHLTTTWQVAYHQHDLPLTPQQIQNGIKGMWDQLPAQLRRQGITDPALINTIVASQVKNYRRVSRAASYHSSTQWALTRDGARTLVEGVHQLISDDPGVSSESSQSCRLFYDGDTGLFINDANQSGQTREPVSYSYVWESPGDSVRYGIPVPTSFIVPPEEMAILGGFSPLAMYGASWRVTAETPSMEQIETHMDDIGGVPANLMVQLSRTHGLAPSRIEVDYTGAYSVHTIIYTTTSYQQYGTGWLCSKVEVTDHIPQQADNQYTFVLAGVAQASPIISVDNGNMVDDFRLLGPKSHIDISLTSDQKKDIVMYPWPGHFLSISEIKQIQAKSFPGEATPDPASTTSMLPTVGGLACLIGGILTYRRRGNGGA